MVKILIGCTGSVAAIKLPKLIQEILKEFEKADQKVEIRVVTTEKAEHFFRRKDLGKVDVFCDKDEWKGWSKRGDDILHIELGKWGDILLLVPLDANSLGKIGVGICDNIVLSTVRAWGHLKPLLFCPAMNNKMYTHPITAMHRKALRSWGYIEVPVTEKVLMCGEEGLGGMAEISTIVQAVLGAAKKK